MKIRIMDSAINLMRMQATEQAYKRREAAVQSHNQNSGVRNVKFETGVYVLRGKLARSCGKKLWIKWIGLYQVAKCQEDYHFDIVNLFIDRSETENGRGLNCFKNIALKWPRR